MQPEGLPRGYRPTERIRLIEVKTTTGPVVYERPRLRGTSEPFAPRLLGKDMTRTNALEAPVLAGLVRDAGSGVGARPGAVTPVNRLRSSTGRARCCWAATGPGCLQEQG